MKTVMMLRKEREELEKEVFELYATLLQGGEEIKKDRLIDCVFMACQFGDISTLKLSLGQLKAEAESVLQLERTIFIKDFEQKLDPLKIAIYFNHFEICSYLVLQHKIEVTWNVLFEAVHSANDQIFSFLIEHSKLKLSTLTRLLYCMITWSGASLAMIKKVFEAGVNPCDPSEENSCLGLSIIYRKIEFFKFFLELKPNINFCSEKGSSYKITPFLLAAILNNWHFAKLLLDYKVTPVDVNATQPKLLAPIHYFAINHSETKTKEADIYLFQKKDGSDLYKNAYVIFTAQKPILWDGVPVRYYNSKGNMLTENVIEYTEWKEFAKKIPCKTIQETKPLKDQLSPEILSELWELFELYKIVLKQSEVITCSDNSEAILTLLELGATVEIPGDNNIDFPKAKETILCIKNRQEVFNQLSSLGIFGKSNSFSEGVKLISDYAVDYNSGPVL